MRWLVLFALLTGCESYTERAQGYARPTHAYGIEACQDACRSIGAPNWGYAITGGHFTGCMCLGPVPEVKVCPPKRPADGGSCE